MLDELLLQIFSNQWRVIIIVSVLLLAAAEFGFRIGLRLFRTKDEARKAQISGIQGAMLGLLGLLLGFTFAISVGHYQKRHDLVLQEANSIGTTFLRAALLPESYRAPVEDLLRRYVGVRLDFHRASTDAARQTAATEAAAIQGELWNRAVHAAKESPTPLSTAFITSLNETIDLDASNLHALRTRVPGAVWSLVLAVALGGCCVSGYGAGSSGVRATFTNIALPLLVAVVITLIADLGRPRGGLIFINLQPLIDLQASVASTRS